MLSALLLAGLASLLTACVVLLAQGALAIQRDRRAERSSVLAELAAREGGVGPTAAAEALGTTPRRAEGLLRSLVDDVRFSMSLDEERGEYRYGPTDEGRTRQVSVRGR